MWRAPCRRAERRCVSLHRNKNGPCGLTYLNRLSDALFMIGRWLTHATGNQDIPGNPMTDTQKTAQDLTRIEIRLFLRADRQA